MRVGRSGGDSRKGMGKGVGGRERKVVRKSGYWNLKRSCWGLESGTLMMTAGEPPGRYVPVAAYEART